MSKAFTALPRLADLCESLSFTSKTGDSLRFEFEFLLLYGEPLVKLSLYCWDETEWEGHLYQLFTRTMVESQRQASIEEMIALLEQIQHYGFRDKEQAA